MTNEEIRGVIRQMKKDAEHNNLCLAWPDHVLTRFKNLVRNEIEHDKRFEGAKRK